MTLSETQHGGRHYYESRYTGIIWLKKVWFWRNLVNWIRLRLWPKVKFLAV